LALIKTQDLQGAEEKFREALEHDLYYAPAHNNLGLVLLQTERYYESAWEFDYAAKLAPESPEPRQNLGLLYENLGHVDQAAETYEAALEIDPDNVVAMRHLARAYVKNDRKDDLLKRLLEKLLMIPSDHQWDVWIRGQLVRLGRGDEGQEQPFGHDPPD
jgi:Flp pilus assembly protein TadD